MFGGLKKVLLGGPIFGAGKLPADKLLDKYLWTCLVHTKGSKNYSPAKTACRAPSKLQHTAKKECKQALMMLLCFSGSYAPTAYFLSTKRTLPTKLAGDLPHTPINTCIKAICEILNIFKHSLHSYTTTNLLLCPSSL